MPRSSFGQLLLEEPTGLDRRDDPLVCGFPIPQGQITDPNHLVLQDEAGQPVAAAVDAMARWADGSVKWALVTAPKMDLGAGETQRFDLVARDSSEKSGNDAASHVSVEENAEGVAVDTGRLRFTIGRRGPLVDVFESRVEGQWQKRAVELDDVVAVQREGVETTYLASAAPREIEIEDQNPLRVVVCVRGTHQADDGSTFAPYILRFECLAGCPQLRLTHSLIFDGDPETDRIRASEMTLRAVVGSDQEFAFGGDRGLEARFPRQRAHFTADFRYAELYQDSVTHWRLERWVDLKNRSVFCDEGIHGDGWMELRGDEGRMAVAVRESRQNHPKSLMADAETGLMRIGLYARRAEPLNLTRYSDLVYSHTYECPSFTHFREGVTPPYEPRPRNPKFNAHGIRKTHNVALMFDEPCPSRATLFYNKPLRLSWSPQYTKETGVVAPAGTSLTGRAQAETEQFLDLLGQEMLRSGGTGYIDYFDLPHGFDVESQRWFHDYGGFGYLNNEGMPTFGLWQAYLLTGRRDAFAMGAAMARHNNDIDSFHIGPNAGSGARHNVTHWADQDREVRVSQPLGARFYGYVTGDRSFLDLVPVMMEMWNRQFAEPHAIESHANLPSLIITLLTADEAGYASCDAWLRQCADALATGIDERGVLAGRFVVDAKRQRIEPAEDALPVSSLMLPMFGGPQTYIELAERYDHQPLRDALVRLARYQAQPRPERFAVEAGTDWKNEGGWKEPISIQDDAYQGFCYLDLFGYAYELTGDRSLLRPLEVLDNTLPVALTSSEEARYGEAAASTRTVIVGQLLPGLTDERLAAHLKLFPLFRVDERMQHLRLAMWLHKLQAAAVLGFPADAGADDSGSGRGASEASSHRFASLTNE